MPTSKKNKHLSHADRLLIEDGITKGLTKAEIARRIGKNISAVSKEIKLHRVFKKGRFDYQCARLLGACPRRHKGCHTECSDFVQFTCKRRDKSPGAYNGCERIRKCGFSKYTYDALEPHSEYRELLVESRMGVNISMEDLQILGDKLEPRIKNSHSPAFILATDPSITCCVKTVYNYIHNGTFRMVNRSIKPVDLHRTVRRKQVKKLQKEVKVRKPQKYLNGRTFTDYLAYMAENMDARVVFMDTVYNDGSNGPFLQTFYFFYYEIRKKPALISTIKI